ncbi:hypothetical protein [uncultured Croceitalea sp.]|uniref:hypothetical protein n=1 Tax=uncultured Croceitalea sp. TaxID=1798908 RepID=UPI0033059E1C
MKEVSLIIVLLLSFSCSNDDDLAVIAACDVDNPIQDLAWLRTEIQNREANPTEDMKYCYITAEIYENQTVFAYLDCNPLIDKAILFLNCEGEFLDGSSETVANLGERISQTIIWKPRGFKCNLP